MTMTKNLFLAILSMDSYNRGYGQGISGLSETGSIGNAIIKTRQSSGIDDTKFTAWQAAVFYGIAYDVSSAS
jgi:hypothetical protein